MRLEAESRPRPTARWWDDVDRLFAALPPALFRQVKLLEYDLALRYSPSGQFHDVFSGLEQPPILSVATWLFDDLEFPPGASRDQAERHLFTASALLAMRMQAVEGMREPGGFTTDDHMALVQWLSEQAAAELARGIGREMPYWDAYEATIGAEADRLAIRSAGDGDVGSFDDPQRLLRSPFFAPLRLVALAALAAAGSLDRGTRVAEMLGLMADGYQVVLELASLRRDAELGRVSYPMAVIAQAAHLALRPPPKPEVVLGAMVATGSFDRIIESALDRLSKARALAIELRLPTFAAFLADVEAQFGGPASGPGRPGVAFGQSTPPLSQALHMAEGYLLADPEFRESWETHREGMFGEPEVSSRFPAGLILEILCERGVDVRSSIDEFLQFTVANGFRYYDHPRSGVDADTIGLVLRLRAHATPNADRDRAVTGVLECLDRNIREVERVPVWITGCEGASDSESADIALGEGCATVAANLLLGLLVANAGHEAATIGLRSLLDRIGSVGLGANVNYPPLYALGAFFRLLKLLEGHDLAAAGARVELARGALTDELHRAVSTKPVTAQDAALLILASHDAGRRDLIAPEWSVQVLKRQRFDGSWIGEPFAAAPNRGRSVSWYSSTLLTTALCYDALTREVNQQAAETD